MEAGAAGGTSGLVIDADPEELLAAARKLMAMGEHLATQATTLGKIPGDIGGTWQGHTANSIKSELTALAGQATRFPPHFAHAAQALTGLAQALSEAQTQVAGLNRAREAAVQDHAGAVRRAEQAHEVATAGSGIAKGEIEDAAASRDQVRGRADADRDSAQARLNGQYETLVVELGAHARRVGQVLESATVVPVPDRSVSTYLCRAIPASIGGDLTAEQAAFKALQGGLPLLHRREAEDAAKAVQDLLPAAATGDAEALRRLCEESGQWATDPYFAHALAASLGPDGLTRVANEMQTAMRAGTGVPYLSAQEAKWLATYLGTVVAVASNPAYDKALDESSRAEHTAWREGQWFPDWVRAGNDGGTDGYPALTQLLEAGATGGVQPGAAFMGTVGADILRWDKNTWAVRLREGTGMWGGISPPPGSLLGGFAHPVRSLLFAAKGDRATEQALLLSDVGGVSAVRYLLKDRIYLPWYADRKFTDGWDPGSDDLLGDMVIHADMDRTDQSGTRMASEFTSAYIDGIYESKPLAGGENAGQSSFGVNHASLRPALARILGYHADDLTEALVRGKPLLAGQQSDGTWGIGFGDTRRLAATFADLAFDRSEDLGQDPAALTQQGRTPPALSLLLRQVIGQTGTSLTDLAGQQPLNTGDIAQTASRGATTLRYIVDSAHAGLMGNAEAKDAANKELAQLWSQGIGLIPLDRLGPGAALSGLAPIDEALEGLLPTDHAAGRVVADAQTDTVIDGLMADQIETALANGGAWDAGETPSQWLADSEFPNPEAARFVDDRGGVLPLAKMRPSQMDAYRQFLSDNLVIAGALREARQSGPASSVSVENDYTGYEAP